jgi:outer membrane lipoprotein SlyB
MLVPQLKKRRRNSMRKILMIGIGATLAAMTALPVAANAQFRERTVTGAAIGAGSGAVIAGPPGAVVGGVIGAVVGGPRISRHASNRSCWRDNAGVRHCRYYR